MKWEKRCYPPSFLSSLGIQDILMHQKASNFINSLLFAYVTSVHVWDNMLLQWYISSDLIGQKFMNNWHVGTVNWSPSYKLTCKTFNFYWKGDVIPVLLYIPTKNISFIRKDTKNPFLPWSQLEWERCCGCLDTIDRLPRK